MSWSDSIESDISELQGKYETLNQIVQVLVEGWLSQNNKREPGNIVDLTILISETFGLENLSPTRMFDASSIILSRDMMPNPELSKFIQEACTQSQKLSPEKRKILGAQLVSMINYVERSELGYYSLNMSDMKKKFKDLLKEASDV